MKIKKNIKAFVANELITIIVVCLVLLAVIATVAYQSTNTEKFHIMKYNAYNMASSITNYNIDDNSNRLYYLQELIDNGIHSHIKNPFNSAGECSPIESYVRNDNSKKYVTLKCGSYLIDNQYIGEKTYIIYKVDDFKEGSKKGKNIEEKIKYNYLENGKEKYPSYYDESLFIYMVNKDNNTSFNTISEIKDKVEVVEKTFHRTKKEYIKKQS